MKPAEFIGTLFLARDMAHSAHLNTRSFAKHEALSEFYNGIIVLADKLAEAYQGRHGLIGPIIIPEAKNPGTILGFLEGSLESLEAARYKFCEKTDTALQNIIDEIVGQYLSTIYKLKFLA